MSLLVAVLLGCLTGYLVRRPVILALGPAVGAGILVAAAWQHQSLLDTPAAFTAALATLSLAAGVLVGRALGKDGGIAGVRHP